MQDFPPAETHVAIDPVAWTQSRKIRWPSRESSVLVLEGRSDAEASFLRVASDRHEFRIGEKDGRLVVVLGLEPGMNGGAGAWNFLAAHESFHLAAQFYGTKIPMNYIEIDASLVDQYSGGEIFAGIYDAVDVMHRSLSSGSTSTCDFFLKAYSELGTDARAYFNYKAFWEWPAEFYAYTAAFEGSLADYEVFRSNLFSSDAGYRLFTAGVKVVQMVEGRVGREVWQARAVEGESMLSIFSRAYDCDIELSEAGAVTITRLEHTLSE